MSIWTGIYWLFAATAIVGAGGAAVKASKGSGNGAFVVTVLAGVVLAYLVWVGLGKVASRDSEPSQAMRDVTAARVGKERVGPMLKDASSAMYAGQFMGQRNVPCGQVNSRNSFGAYTGFVRYIAVSPGLVLLDSDTSLKEDFQQAWAKYCR